MSDQRPNRRARWLGVPLVAAAMLSGCAGWPPQTNEAQRESREAVLIDTLEQMGRGSEARHAYATAIDQYARLVSSAPGNEAYVLGLARNLRYGGRPRDAVTILRRALRTPAMADSFATHLELARALLAAGLTSDAEAAVGELRGRAPNDPRVLRLTGMLADRAGRHDEAQAAYRAALAIDATDLRAANNLALSLALSGRLNEAIRLQERTAARDGASVQMRQNLALFHALDGSMARAAEITRATLPGDAADSFIADLARMTGQPAPADASNSAR